MRIVDLFCGTGGFSRGAHLAGLKVVRAYDNDPVLTYSFARNFPDTPLTLADISDLSGADVLRHADSPIDGLIGGPPCQGFSMIGRRDAKDPRSALVNHFFRLVAELLPTFFAMENVVGISQGESRRILDAGLERVPGHYQVSDPIVLDAADFGAPTQRRRVFVIGVDNRRGSMPDIDAMRTEPGVTVRDAIEDISNAVCAGTDEAGFDLWQLPDDSSLSKYAIAMRSADSRFTGNRRTRHCERVRNRFSELEPGATDRVGRHHRLDWNGRCPTLRAGTGSDKGSYQSVRPIHPDEPRVITVREAARLQGFPDSHRFHPTIWHSFRMIGNSVSPFMGSAVLSAVSSGCEANHSI